MSVLRPPEVREIRTCIGSAREQGWLVPDDELPRGAFILVERDVQGRMFCLNCVVDFTQDCPHVETVLDWIKGIRSHQPLTPVNPGMYE